MPGGRFFRRNRAENDDLTKWKWHCSRKGCDVEGYSPKSEPCWNCGKKDKMKTAWSAPGALPWTNTHEMRFAGEESDAAT